jgi:hypothetical protein
MGNLPKLEDLEVEKRLLVYGWARDAIDSGMKQQIAKKSYTAFVTALHGGTQFSMDHIWEGLAISTKEHFEHASDIMLHLDDEIETLEDLLEHEEDETNEDRPVPDDPFKDPEERNDGEG